MPTGFNLQLESGHRPRARGTECRQWPLQGRQIRLVDVWLGSKTVSHENLLSAITESQRIWWQRAAPGR